MLFALPSSASGPTRPAAPTVGTAEVRGLGDFWSWLEALGTVLRVSTFTTVRRSGFHGWFAERQSVTFQAERKEGLGTVLFSPIIPRARTGFHGWFAARAADFFSREQETAFGTAPTSVHNTAVRPAFHGWFSGRRPLIFQAERKEGLGTVLFSPITPQVRAGFHGWFSARTADFFFKGQGAALGTASDPVRNTAVRPVFHGWFSGRQPMISMSRGRGEGGNAPGCGYHVSVLADEVEEWIAASQGKFVIDGTLGGGGHSERMLEAGARVLGVDRDPEALEYASRRLARFGDKFRVWQGNFSDLQEAPGVQGGEQADGLLLDLGVSSHQLDAPERGFSFRSEGPLDMRMGPATSLTAADVVNTASPDELVRILREYGEEARARKIVEAIVARREQVAFETTMELAECIEKAVGRTGRIHPATRSFQAIRIVVNDELGSLERALEASVHLLKPGGRLLVITFQSLEDRLVKRFMQERARPFLDQPDWPEPRPNPRWSFRLPHRKAIAPSDAEIRVNPRARSAKLRVAELLDPEKSRA